MNWRIVSLITGREIRDLLRDRRSVFLLLVLPVLLYPGFGLIGYFFAARLMEQVSPIGIYGLNHLPKTDRWQELSADQTPPLLVGDHFADQFAGSKRETRLLPIVPLTSRDRGPLDRREVDVMLIVPDDFMQQLQADQTVNLEIINRDGDESSKLATRRLKDVLENYESAVKAARFARKGLPKDFDRPIVVREPKDAEPALQRTSDELRDRLAKFIPFLLVMWALAGALHPAIDLCAGEKERGTMETLLISPAERSEIVAGKFFAVWIYSTATVLWNLIWIGALCIVGGWYFGITLFRPANLAICMLLALPMTALFSALSIGLGIFARSSKEGQYYLLPLFLGVMPLVMLSMMPNADLTWGMSVVPVTGLCLLVQKMIGPAPVSEILPYVGPVLGSLLVCALLACWWAVRQFHREDVLFRESEGAGVRGWLSGFDQGTKR